LSSIDYCNLVAGIIIKWVLCNESDREISPNRIIINVPWTVLRPLLMLHIKAIIMMSAIYAWLDFPFIYHDTCKIDVEHCYEQDLCQIINSWKYVHLYSDSLSVLGFSTLYSDVVVLTITCLYFWVRHTWSDMIHKSWWTFYQNVDIVTLDELPWIG
jgi:hypothetical protein